VKEADDYFAKHGRKEVLVELGSDQTSCHNPFNGGYYPVDLSFSQANELMATNPVQFKYVLFYLSFPVLTL
jgi:urocanate hydratase